MTGRVLALPIGAVLLLGIGVYLYIQVRATPATPDAGSRRTPVTSRTSEPVPPETTTGTPKESPPDLPRLPHGRKPEAEDRAAVAGRTPLADEPEAKPSGTPGIDAKLDSVMQQANRAYDRGDLDEAKMIATRVLSAQPDNVRMLRILVSSACIDGDSATAQANFSKLPAVDQEQMRARCTRYGMTL